MKTITLAILLFTYALSAQERVVSLMLSEPTIVTNSLNIADYETAEILSAYPIFDVSGTEVPQYLQIYLEKGGRRVLLTQLDRNLSNAPIAPRDVQLTSLRPFIIAGPARIDLVGTSGLVTFKISPNAYPVGKTVMIPPGPGGAAVGLESSPDLVKWTAATNGVFTNLNTALFFRINLQRIKP